MKLSKERPLHTFRLLLTEDEDLDSHINTTLLQEIPSLISNEDNHALLKDIEEEEVYQVVWGLGARQSSRT
jgi:hypothetical protein